LTTDADRVQAEGRTGAPADVGLTTSPVRFVA
jgi:hypothetical protein